ncbi:glycosyltransferase family 2 protein [Microbacterium esteraromaticum]|nr:glycosyltransferase family 2 protein [Microbacterium esteraromaticum]
MPRTSIILPGFNAFATVERAIGSVLAQHDEDIELIMVDDGSTDRTPHIMRSVADPRVRVIEHAANRGISAARNSGLDAATGEFIVFLDADDSWEPDFLLRMHEARGEADAVVCGRVVVTNDGSTRNAHSARLGDMSGTDAALAMMVGGITPFPWDKLIRRSALDDLRFPEDIHRFEDQAVGIIALSRVGRVVSIPDALIHYHVSAQSLTWGRVPSVEEALSALAFIREELGEWLAVSGREASFDVCRTMFLMLTAQSAMRSLDGAASTVVASARRHISSGMVVATLRRRPVIGAGATLLKIAPGVYRWILLQYLRRRYSMA